MSRQEIRGKSSKFVILKVLCSSTQLRNRSFHDGNRTRASKKCTKMKNPSAKRAKLLFLIVKHAKFWCCYRQLCRVCFSSPIIHKDSSENAPISNISIRLTEACNASKLVNYSSDLHTYNANVCTTGDDYHIKYSSTHKQCIFFSR